MLPSAGWYPSPDRDPRWLQYWDGQQWTEHRAPAASGATQPKVAASGLRSVGALFTDWWTIVRRAWWPITAVGLVLWGAWALVVAVMAAVLRFGEWADLLSQWVRLPEDADQWIVDQLEQRTSDLSSAVGAGPFIVAGATLAVVSMLVVSAHYAAAYRLGAEAASGRPATFGVGLDGIRAGTLRTAGYILLLAVLAGLAISAALLLPMVLADYNPFAAIVLMLLLSVLACAALYGVHARMVPAFVQASLPDGSGALGWAWQATKGRFWAVFGRYLLWLLAVSVAVNLAYSVLYLPLFFVGMVVAAAASAWQLLLGGLAITVLFAAVSGFCWLGPVAIWRDLTPDPDYRAIDGSGAFLIR